MNNPIFKEFSPLQKLLLFIGVTFFSAVIFSLIGVNVVNQLYQVNLQELSRNELRLNNINALKLLTLFSHLGMFIFPSFFFLILIKDSFNNFFTKNSLPKKLIYILPILFIGVSLLSEWSLFLNQQIDFESISSSLAYRIRIEHEDRDAMIKAFIDGSWVNLLVNLFLIAIIPAIGEELAFRGVLQPLFIQLSNKKHVSIIFVAFIFAFIHFQFLDFLPRFVLGIIYGYVYLFSKNIYTTIFLHFLNNLIALLIVFYSVRTQEQILEQSSGGSPFIFLFGLLFTFGGLYLLRKK